MSEKKKTTDKEQNIDAAGAGAAAGAAAGPAAGQAGAQDNDPKPSAAESGDKKPDPEDGGGKKKSGWGAGELEALRTENAELKDRLLRTVAEMENVRRRTERDKADTAKYAVSNFARDVLTIGDNLRRAIEHVPEEAVESDPNLKSFLDGVEVTERELLNMLERHGITRIDPKGERFDPNHHQAMFELQNPDVPEGTIMEVVQAGYMIAERVLRPAMVGVAKGGPKAPKPAETEAPDTAATEQSPKPDTAESAAPGGVGENVDKSA